MDRSNSLAMTGNSHAPGSFGPIHRHLTPAVHPAIFPNGARQSTSWRCDKRLWLRLVDFTIAISPGQMRPDSADHHDKSIFVLAGEGVCSGSTRKKGLDDPREGCLGWTGPTKVNEAGGGSLPVRGETNGRRATIRDVAERAGVSKSLVSLVMRGEPMVRQEKRRRVQQAADELGYRMNLSARPLSLSGPRPSVCWWRTCATRC